MILSVSAEELSRAVFNFAGIKANVTFTDKIYIRLVKVVPIYVVLVPKVNQNLEFEIDCVKAGGINITALARNQIFATLNRYNNDYVIFEKKSRAICLSIKGVKFQNAEIINSSFAIGIKNE
jgi:hypothetical protein